MLVYFLTVFFPPHLSMLAVVQKKKSFDEIFFDYFKENKTEIAHAIPELFPFLESLKDRSFITDKTYAVSDMYSSLQGTSHHIINRCLAS